MDQRVVDRQGLSDRLYREGCWHAGLPAGNSLLAGRRDAHADDFGAVTGWLQLRLTAAQLEARPHIWTRRIAKAHDAQATGAMGNLIPLVEPALNAAVCRHGVIAEKHGYAHL